MSLLADDYRVLYDKGESLGFVITPDGFGMAVERAHYVSTSDVIVEYFYPKPFFEAYAPSYVRRIDFMVVGVEEDAEGRYTVEYAVGKDQTEKTPLTDPMFDIKAMNHESARIIIMRAYERWKLRHAIDNPFNDPTDVSESSACFPEPQPAPWDSSEEVKTESIDSAYEVVYEYSEVSASEG